MARFFDRSRTYIFLAPVAIAMSGDGGCASSKVEALSAEQVTSTVVGNTVQKDGEEIYAYIGGDNMIKAKVSKADAVEAHSGTWKLSDEGEFCVTWLTQEGKDNCSKFQALEDDKLQWGDVTLAVFKGNPKDL